MPKGKTGITPKFQPTDHLTTTEVSQLLGIHRNTLQRMATSMLLPPDGRSGGGRSYWLRSSVETYRLGMLTTATVWYVTGSHIEELNLKLQNGQRILGQGIAAIPTQGTTRTEALGGLLSFITSTKMHALAVPSSSAGTGTYEVVRDACREGGIPLVLYPQ